MTHRPPLWDDETQKKSIIHWGKLPIALDKHKEVKVSYLGGMIEN